MRRKIYKLLPLGKQKKSQFTWMKVWSLRACLWKKQSDTDYKYRFVTIYLVSVEVAANETSNEPDKRLD